MRPSRTTALLLVLLAWGGAACTGPEPGGASGGTGIEGAGRSGWAIALHGGAGAIPRTASDDERQGYLDSLTAALRLGAGILQDGGAALDAVERVIALMEDDPRFNAGKGAVFDHDGGHQLDASIMEGASLGCGAVAAVRTVKNPILLARLVMERTPHVLLAGTGAERFADTVGVERVEQAYFFTQRRHDAWQRRLTESSRDSGGGTVGVVVLDTHGHLAAGTSTGGLTNKMYGRVGDSPIVGAGTYADDRTCAVSATGKGEEFIRHGVARAISMRVELGDADLERAVRSVIHETLRPGDGGVIAVGRDGRIVMEFNTEGMYRGAADATGRFEVRIWR